MNITAPAGQSEFRLTDLNNLRQAAEYVRSLAHPHRLRMVQMLLHNQYTVGELAEACRIPSAQASGHLRLLERSGLLRYDRQGRKIFYRVSDPFLEDLIAWVEKWFSE